jgi:hypothetical protein
MLNDLKFALRQLRKSPGFAAAVIVTLALGIGVNAAVFGMVDGFMLRRLPYPEPQRIASPMTHIEGTSDSGHHARSSGDAAAGVRSAQRDDGDGFSRRRALSREARLRGTAEPERRRYEAHSGRGGCRSGTKPSLSTRA